MKLFLRGEMKLFYNDLPGKNVSFAKRSHKRYNNKEWMGDGG